MEIIFRNNFFFLQQNIVFYDFHQNYQSIHVYIIHLLEGDKEVRKKEGERAEEQRRTDGGAKKELRRGGT